MTSPTVNGRPGVTVNEVLLPRDTGGNTGSVSRSVLLADLDRGPATPTTVSSWSEFRALFGDWADNAPGAESSRNASVDAAYLFFANAPSGGSSLVVARVVRSDATYSAGDLTDSQDAAAIEFESAIPGKWGDNIRVTVAGTWSTSGTFDDAFSNEFTRANEEYGGGNLTIIVEARDGLGRYTQLERFPGLSLTSGNRRFASDVVNGTSRFITMAVSDTSDLTAVNTSVPLAGGADGVADLNIESVLASLDYYVEPLTISWSGHTSSADLQKVVSYCQTRGDSFLIVDVQDVGPKASDVVSAVSGLGITSPFAAAYYPSLVINDPASGMGNVQRKALCGGAVLGAYAANDVAGIWRTPAGPASSLRGVVGPLYRFSNTDLDTFNSATHPVNPIRTIIGSGTCIMGGRTLSQSGSDRYVGVRRSFSYLRSRMASLTEFAIFEINGPDLWEEIRIRLENFLGLYYQRGAFRGGRESDAFYVRCDSSNNTPGTMAAGEVHIEVGVAVEYPAEFVVITLTHNQSSVRVG